MNSVVLRPVSQAGYWRVELAWPNNFRHYFGKFNSRTEAEKWIADHHWLTRESQVADVPPDAPEATPD